MDTYLRFVSDDSMDSAVPLIAIGPAGTWPHWWHDIAVLLRPHLEVFAVTLPGRASRLDDDPLQEVSAMAADVLAWLPAVINQERPFHVVGVCGGSLVAHQLASRLVDDGTEPESLHLFSVPLPSDLNPSASDGDIVEAMILEGTIPAEVAHEPEFLELYGPAIYGDYRAAATFEWAELASSPATSMHVHHALNVETHPLDNAWRQSAVQLHHMDVPSSEVVGRPAESVGAGLLHAIRPASDSPRAPGA